MVAKISGLARALYIVLAIVAGFVALGMMDVALVLVVLGLIAGLSAPRDRLVLAFAAIIALPAVGAQLTAICGNLGLGIAGAATTMLAMYLYDLVMDGVMGLTGGSTGRATATA